MQEFRVSDLIAESFESWIKNLVPFTTIFVAGFAPLAAWLGVTFAVGAWDAPEAPGGWHAWGLFPALVITVLAFSLVTATIMHVVVQQRRGVDVRISESVSVAFRRLLPFMGVGIVSAILVFLGFLVLVIPGLILYCMFFVVQPISVIERSSVTESLRRSVQLTQGKRWTIFCTLIGLSIVQSVLQFILSLVAAVPAMVSPWLGAVSSIAIGVAMLSIFPVAIAVTYDGLCRVTEESAPPQLASAASEPAIPVEID